MPKRFLVAVLITLTPYIAYADDPASGDATPAPSTVTEPAAPNAPAAELGPSTSSAAGGSSADAGALQPAGTTPLQSTTGDASGLSAPNGSPLQAPASSGDALRVLAAEGEGQQPAADSAPSRWGWLWFSLLIGVVVAGTALFLRRRQNRRPHP